MKISFDQTITNWIDDNFKSFYTLQNAIQYKTHRYWLVVLVIVLGFRLETSNAIAFWMNFFPINSIFRLSFIVLKCTEKQRKKKTSKNVQSWWSLIPTPWHENKMPLKINFILFFSSFPSVIYAYCTFLCTTGNFLSRRSAFSNFKLCTFLVCTIWRMSKNAVVDFVY